MHDGHPFERALEAAQIAAHGRPERGVEPGRDAAFVFAVFGQYPAAAGNGEIRQRPTQRGFDRGLVVAVQKREQQVDGHRLDAGIAQLFDEGIAHRLVKRDDRLPLRVEPGIHFETQLGRHRYRIGRGFEGIQLAPGLTADGQHVGKAGIRDIGRTRQIVFQHGVGRHGGAVHDPPIGRGLAGKMTYAVDHGLLGRVRGGGNLVDRQGALLAGDHVSERSAGIHAQLAGAA